MSDTRLVAFLLTACVAVLMYGVMMFLLRDKKIRADGYYTYNHNFIIITSNECNYNGDLGEIVYYKGNNFLMVFKEFEISGFYGHKELKILNPGEKIGDTHKFITYRMG